MRGGNMAIPDRVKAAAKKLGEAKQADILFFNGEIRRGIDTKFITCCVERKRRKNVILVLVTPGGDADAAYRMARCLQGCYDEITIFVPGWCKSAGTLLAIGAHKLVMSAHGELGPLDIQIGKQDELFEAGSGLDLEAALEQLETTAFQMFERYMLAIERASGARISFKTASEISSKLVSELIGNIYAQIDPTRMGETSRLMKIARDYGARLAARSGSLKLNESLDILVSSYSTHSFVIDFDEAFAVFTDVERSDDDYDALQDALGNHALVPFGDEHDTNHLLTYLNEEKGYAAQKGAPVASRPRGRAAGSKRNSKGRPSGTPGDSGEAVAAEDTGSNATVVRHPSART